MIPAITLWQPWASLVACGAKTFETRAFPCPHRLLGKRVAIHAAKRPVTLVGLDHMTVESMMKALGCFGRATTSSIFDLPRGAVVCTAVIMYSDRAETVRPDLFGDYSPGRWAWSLEMVERIDPPIPATGRQMIGWPWEPPEDECRLMKFREARADGYRRIDEALKPD